MNIGGEFLGRWNGVATNRAAAVTDGRTSGDRATRWWLY